MPIVFRTSISVQELWVISSSRDTIIVEICCNAIVVNGKSNKAMLTLEEVHRFVVNFVQVFFGLRTVRIGSPATGSRYDVISYGWIMHICDVLQPMIVATYIKVYSIIFQYWTQLVVHCTRNRTIISCAVDLSVSNYQFVVPM